MIKAFHCFEYFPNAKFSVLKIGVFCDLKKMVRNFFKKFDFSVQIKMVLSNFENSKMFVLYKKIYLHIFN